LTAASCIYCSVVNRVCFWGPYPKASWKRPLLLLCATPFLVGIPALFWLFRDHQDPIVLYVLGVPLFIFATLGLLVGVRGCDACVARMSGSI
jgi:hypothetical protein